MSSDTPPAQFAALYDEASSLVHRTAYRITGTAADAEDVLQSVFLHLLKTTPPAPWPERPMAYIHRAAVNSSLDLLRKRKRRAESAIEFDVAEDHGRSEEDAAVSRLTSQRAASNLTQAMTDLSPLEAEVFSLRFLEEKSASEIAELLGKTANHVRVTLHGARRKLRQTLAGSAAPKTERTDRESDQTEGEQA